MRKVSVWGLAAEGPNVRRVEGNYKGRKKTSGATNKAGAPETRIAVPMELVLTPRGNRLNPGTWTRGHRSNGAYSSGCLRQPFGSRQANCVT